ncbi:hypothetical protein BGZ81_000540 [Podila clonocystis]|nr:hypothetical protein BGZ81_000540 [Podila clonocystis]
MAALPALRNVLLSVNTNLTMALPTRRSRPQELENVIMKPTSTIFFHALSCCTAILADVSLGQDLEQHEMVVAFNSEHVAHLATAFRRMKNSQNQGILQNQFYRVSGTLTTLKSAGQPKQYILTASSIVKYQALAIPEGLIQGTPIVDVNDPPGIHQALLNPAALPRVE